METFECVSDEICAYQDFMSACQRVVKFYEKASSLPGGQVQLFAQIAHLIQIVKDFRTETRKWCRENKIHAVKEALNIEKTNLTEAKKVAKILTLLLADGMFINIINIIK